MSGTSQRVKEKKKDMDDGFNEGSQLMRLL